MHKLPVSQVISFNRSVTDESKELPDPCKTHCTLWHISSGNIVVSLTSMVVFEEGSIYFLCQKVTWVIPLFTSWTSSLTSECTHLSQIVSESLAQLHPTSVIPLPTQRTSLFPEATCWERRVPIYQASALCPRPIVAFIYTALGENGGPG